MFIFCCCNDGRIILKWILEKWDVGMDWIDLAQDTDGCCECGNEPSGSVKCGGIS
jgi:hypothetical protein